MTNEKQFQLVLLDREARTFTSVDFTGDVLAAIALQAIRDLEDTKRTEAVKRMANRNQIDLGNGRVLTVEPDLSKKTNTSGRAVYVTEVDEEAFMGWRIEQVKKGKPEPGWVVFGQRFPSAAAASTHLGLNIMYIAQLLRAGDATAHGVAWSYKDPINC